MDKQAILDTWTMFRREHNNVSVDRMICDPSMRTAFLNIAVPIAGDATESQILWTLMSLRKRKMLPRNQQS